MADRLSSFFIDLSRLFYQSTAERPSFTESIVSKLGTPKEPFGVEDLLGLAIVLVVVLSYVAIEVGIGTLILRLVGWFKKTTSSAKDDAEID